VMGVPPTLIDLSIARRVERAEKTEGPIGTDPYMAPEQCGDDGVEARIGPATDVWGLGATLFHAVSGEKPFLRGSGDEGPERFPQLIEAPGPLPRHVPEAVRELIGEMLDPDPAERPTCEEVVGRLEPVIAGLPRKARLRKRGAIGI
jgi:eukaryotic-like serine/threonine-protein kinase